MLKAIQKSLHLTIAAVTGVSLLLCQVEVKDSGRFQLSTIGPATAQLSIPADSGRRVYELLPNFPLENQYVSKETGKVDSNNTLLQQRSQAHRLSLPLHLHQTAILGERHLYLNQETPISEAGC